MADESMRPAKPKKVTLGQRVRDPNIVMVTMDEGVILKNEHLPTSQHLALDDVDADEAIRLLCRRRGYDLPAGFGKPSENLAPASMTKGLPPPKEVVLGEEYVDLTLYTDIDTFDLVMRAIEGVVEQSQTLSLDNDEDRRVLIALLRKSVGCVVEPEEMRLCRR